VYQCVAGKLRTLKLRQNDALGGKTVGDGQITADRDTHDDSPPERVPLSVYLMNPNTGASPPQRMTGASNYVIVDQADCLHLRVGDLRSNESKAALDQVLAQCERRAVSAGNSPLP
jgi:hypothetical protein